MPQSWTSFVMTGQYKRTKLPQTNATDAYRRDKVEVSTFGLASKPLAGSSARRSIATKNTHTSAFLPARSVGTSSYAAPVSPLSRLLMSERSYRGLFHTQSSLCRFCSSESPETPPAKEP